MKNLSFKTTLIIITAVLNFSDYYYAQTNNDMLIEGRILLENYRIYPSNVSQTEVFIVTHPSNPDIMFSSANTIIFNPFFISEGIYVTLNGGNSWYGSDTCNGAPISLHGGDPGITINKDGTFIITRRGFSPGLYSHYSTDLGMTWSNQKTITNDDLERATLASDVQPSSPYYGRSYAVWIKFAPPFPLQFTYTDDGGVNWASPIQVNNPTQRGAGGDIAIGPNSKIYICWAGVISISPFTEDFVGVASSTNGGTTWQVTENAFDMNGINGLLPQKGNIRVNGLPDIAVDTTGGPRNGWIYIITTQKNLAPAGSDPDVILNRSTDNGQTWSAGIRVNQDPVNNGKIQYFPAIHVDEQGGLNVIFYDDRSTTSDSTGVYLARSEDGGNSWIEYEISNHNFKPIPIGGLGQGYQGDNISITSSRNKLWPVWMDNSTGLYQIWTAPIDTNIFNYSYVIINQPNGGEIWQVYSTQHITWQSNGVDNVKIEYSSNNGTSWELIADNYPAISGDYNWIIPNTPSSSCRVKISATQFPNIIDISDNTFTISVPPTITVTSPNGGENWIAGSSHDITWTSNNVTNVKLEYTTNNGTNWVTIIASTPSDGSYAWTIPNTPSNNCKVKISDVTNSLINDLSDNPFTIIQPYISVISPNGGEIWQVGSIENITWDSENIVNVKIDYTTNNGSSWILIINSVPAGNGIYSWTIPNTISSTCRVRISDLSNLNFYDQSDNVFSIIPTPSINIIYPNGGETLEGTVAEILQFSSVSVDSVSIYYSIDAGINWITIVSSTPANGSFNWVVPNINSQVCLIKITDTKDMNTFDVSDDVFQILVVGWFQQGSSVLKKLNSIDVINSNFIYACGDDGTILKTTDSGENWLNLSTGIFEDLYSMKFVSENTGWVVGQDGLILRTTNGGLSWSYQNSNTNNLLKSVCFINENTGWIAGDNGIILKTTDVGNNWILQQSNVSMMLNSIAFNNSSLGWVVGNSGAYLKTVNGGQSWTQQTVGTPTNLNSIYFINDSRGYIVGNNGTILLSEDGGEVWANVSNNTLDFYSITFSSSETGFAVGDLGRIYKTTDSGYDWFRIGSGNSYDLLGVDFANSTIGWTVGDNGTILKTTNGGGTFVTTTLTAYAPIGSQSLEVASINGFNIGDQITINPGGENEETNTITGFGSILIQSPLQFNHFAGEIVINFVTVSVEEELMDDLPTEFLLSQNFPNPFNPSTKLFYSVLQSTNVLIKVFDVLGNEVAILVNEYKPAGRYEVEFNAGNLPSGVYFYRLQAGDFISTKKMILMK